MKLTVFNGSPRGKNSNSHRVMTSFLNGFLSNSSNKGILLDMAGSSDQEDLIDTFRESDNIIIIFPLYLDSMPGIVKEFIESISGHGTPDRSVGYILHSGFPESLQSSFIEKYLEKLTRDMQCNYLGTVIRGGTEVARIPGIQTNSLNRLVCKLGILTDLFGVGHLLSEKILLRDFYNLGKEFGITGYFDTKICKKLAQPEKIGKNGFRIYRYIGDNYYWKVLLEKNGAYERNFDRPYV